MCVCHVCMIKHVGNYRVVCGLSTAISGPCVTALRLASTGKNVPTGGQPEEGRQCAEGTTEEEELERASEGCRIPY